MNNIRRWWDQLNQKGPGYGYYPNASKTWLLVKPSAQDRARELFGDSGVNITTDERRLLGACLSTETSVHQYVSNAVAGFVQQVELLSKVAITEPHAAFAAFTHAVMASPEDGSSYRAIIRYRLVQVRQNLNKKKSIITGKTSQQPLSVCPVTSLQLHPGLIFGVCCLRQDPP